MVLQMSDHSKTLFCFMDAARREALLQPPSMAQAGCVRLSICIARGPGLSRAGENQIPADWETEIPMTRDLPPKPKWMRWGTYNRHVQRFNEYEDVVEENTFGQLARLLNKG